MAFFIPKHQNYFEYNNKKIFIKLWFFINIIIAQVMLHFPNNTKFLIDLDINH